MHTISSSVINRRQALKTIGAGVALTSMVAFTGQTLAAKPATKPMANSTETPSSPISAWDLPKLAFEYDALEPHIDTLTMQLHHSKHHQTYITNAKKLLEAHPDWRNRTPDFILKNIETVPEVIRAGLRNNVGGHVNHSFFWTTLAPNAGGVAGNTIGEAITANFGSFGEFQKQFTDAAMKRFGSGWAWLVAQDGKLAITSTANQDSPLSTGGTPLLGLDVWEHAYYLHYQNRRADYIAAFWNVVNWSQVDAYHQATL